MGKSEWNNRLLPTTLIITATAISFGYDTSWWGGAIAQPYFNVFYGDQLVKTPPVHYVLSAYQTSTAVSVSYLFQVIGLVSCGFVLKYGRKMGLYTICATTVIGTIISLTGAIGKGRYWQIVAGKWIVSIALGMSLGTCPLFLAEVAPPTLRGTMVNTCTTMVTLGGFVAGCVNYAVSLMGFNPAGLQILIAVQLIVPVITACCIWSVPESPRWLVEVGKIDKARETLNFLRRGNPQNEIEAELVSIQATIDLDRRIAAASSWVQLFKGSDLRRTLTVTGVSCLAQASGLAFLGNYAVLYLLDVGITNVFIILMILNGVICAGTFAGFYTQDHFGRRAVLLTTGVISTSALISMGAIATAKPNQPGPSAYAIVFLLFVWAVFYGTGWGNVPITLTSELPSDVLRPKTWAFSGSLTAITGMIISLVNPYLQNPGYGNLQGSVAFIYGAFGIIALIFVYYLVPEVKGKSIYEINWLYVNGIAPRDFRNFQVPPPETTEAKLEGGDIDDKEEVAHAEDAGRIA